MRPWRALILILPMLLATLPHSAEARRHHRSVSHSAAGEKDPRYAALIMNPSTGEIYYSRNADDARYPASLTKMMTLYLLFEDLAAKKVDLDTRFKVSAYAATMPQTNLSLEEGDTIPVDTAIKALVVRSANDVAIVVAENLGGSVEKFAVRMTETAHQLGMSHTIFKNPNGLPNDAQHTTASDLAKLGIALKRDFPQYYDYFAVRQFSWRGATYYTHNRVLLRYAGTDGIKTGYIGKSGFNLVTSCERGGRPLIGVVLGGTSGRWRDDQMINLLNKGYRVIASRGQKSGRVYASNLPNPMENTPHAPVAKQARVETPAPAKLSAAENPNPDSGLSNAAGKGELWGIQVGAFSSQALAEQAVKQAYNQASSSLQGSRMAVVDSGGANDGIHRARLENLSEKQARKACELLISQNSPCFIYRADTQNL